jgi:hypothetical protein
MPRLPLRRRPRTVLGHRIPEPRLTLLATCFVFLVVAFPVLVVGGLADLALQFLFGLCTGLWC